jgi:hypothetical protein
MRNKTRRKKGQWQKSLSKGMGSCDGHAGSIMRTFKRFKVISDEETTLQARCNLCTGGKTYDGHNGLKTN